MAEDAAFRLRLAAGSFLAPKLALGMTSYDKRVHRLPVPM
jgi:hypothetical protein